jgi:FlaA1/EpsC-like NDP-sugar epimerase
MRRTLSISSVLFRLFETEFILSAFNHCVNLPHRLRRYILFGVDSLFILIATCTAIGLRFEELLLLQQVHFYREAVLLEIPVKFCIFYCLGMYRPLVRHTGAEVLWLTLKSVVMGEAGLLAMTSLLGIPSLPRSVQVISALITWIAVIGVRFAYRQFLILSHAQRTALGLRSARQLQETRSPQQRIIVYGAGSAGFRVSQALAHEAAYEIVAFVDDDPEVHGRFLNGCEIYSPELLPSLVKQFQVKVVLMAVPSATAAERRSVLNRLRGLPIKVKTVPAITEIVSGKVSIGEMRNVDIADLLGRDEVLPDPSLLRVDITDKVVLVTGAGGSIGSELCRQIAQQVPRLLVLYELNEFALYSIDAELAEHYPDIPRVAHLGSVADSERLITVFETHQVQTVYHAAAYKHVPLIEMNPAQGILNNVYGTLVTARAAEKCGVDTFVLISTDKAVRPTSIMGTTKRIAEMVLQALAANPACRTRFVMVRFGNVLDSNGSVVPRFRQLIAERKPLTVTHPEMTRYFMSIPEASRLVIQAGAMGQGGDVFLLDMGEPVKIYDLAVQMIELSGLVLDEDITIEITGLRPGEKLYEELLIDSDTMETNHPKIFSARESMLVWEKLEPLLDHLFLAACQNNVTKLRSLLKTLVPEYKLESSTLSLRDSNNVAANRRA